VAANTVQKWRVKFKEGIYQFALPQTNRTLTVAWLCGIPLASAAIAFLLPRLVKWRSLRGERMLADLLQPIAEALFEVLFYYFGRVVVPLISLGRWHCEPLLSDVPKYRLRWGGIFHYRGPQLYLTSEGTALVGFLFCVLVVGAGFLFWFLDK
jgi:hypothetical protein